VVRNYSDGQLQIEGAKGEIIKKLKKQKQKMTR